MRKAVVTICIGDLYERLGALTHPAFQAYARKVGAELVVWRDAGTHRLPHYRKLDLGMLLGEYDRVLYLDTDIVIRPDAPDLFARVPEDCLGLFNQGPYHDYEASVARFLAEEGFDPRLWDRRYFNTGVILASRGHRELFVRPAVEREHFFEQTYLNLLFARSRPRIHELGPEWNCLPCIWQSPGWDGHCYFAHYAGASLGNQERELLQAVQGHIAAWSAYAPAPGASAAAFP
jgi:hypothetical protein